MHTTALLASFFFFFEFLVISVGKLECLLFFFSSFEDQLPRLFSPSYLLLTLLNTDTFLYT